MNSIKHITITFDDLPFVSKRASIDDVEEATKTILYNLQQNSIATVGFVVGEQVFSENETERWINLLKNWQDEGHILANHTFSHLSLNDVSTDVFKEDIDKNERFLKRFWDVSTYKEHFFRFPYLHQGNTDKYKEIEPLSITWDEMELLNKKISPLLITQLVEQTTINNI